MSDHDKATKEQVAKLRARVNRMIARELARCHVQMGDAAWQQHAEWVTSNVVAGAKEWLWNQATKGEL